jgi:hypothetical protein
MPAGGEVDGDINTAVGRRLKELAVGLKEFAVPGHNGAADTKP